MRVYTLCIFCNHRTYTFRDVTILCDNEYCLMFRYTAMSDGLVKTATFPKATICGWSITELGIENSPKVRQA